MKKLSLFVVVLCMWLGAAAQNGIDTFHIYFDLNVNTLSEAMQRKIDLLIYNDRLINGSSIMVIGYADYLGSEGYNKNLSMQRAENIKKYLVKYGIDEQFVKLCTGKGKIDRKEMTGKDGNPTDRKVDIVINNNLKFERLIRPTKQVVPIAAADKPKDNKKLGKSIINDSAGTRTSKGKDPRSTGVAIKNNAPKGGADIKDLSKLKEGETILLKNVYFFPCSHRIKPESTPTLEKLYDIMESNPNLRISIEGHVCCINQGVPDALDNDTDEPTLSVNRARELYVYLVNKGIVAERIQYIGFGKQHPIVEFERSEEDADLNRRVEVRVLSNQ